MVNDALSGMISGMFCFYKPLIPFSWEQTRRPQAEHPFCSVRTVSCSAGEGKTFTQLSVYYTCDSVFHSIV